MINIELSNNEVAYLLTLLSKEKKELQGEFEHLEKFEGTEEYNEMKSEIESEARDHQSISTKIQTGIAKKSFSKNYK
ncbi:hypothetical protein [Flammeovirga sp. OC4]|uniref:hypothetical protein n=1 Tax=Flammeovirga sp. OC4 TaxID=1382345 RepID=UPI0005C6A172|nr:hypothetical protein [Flammeovirga sp. OC4]